jgi:putative oxygen-independent coproporphyrinogen III oxidase
VLPLKKPLALYIHWPFCLSKCPYCDFNSHVRESIDIDLWKKALLADLQSFAAHTENFKVSSIFFGGGTPSLMPPPLVESLLKAIAAQYTLSSHVEITLEANPTSVEIDNFQALSSAGINRLSLGVQSLNAKDLKFLGRTHSLEDALRAIHISDQFFKRRSFDLIYTLPGQSIDMWQTELEKALGLAGDHLSLYQLTIEQGTPFYLAHHRGDFQMASEDISDTFFEWTHGFMKDRGYPAYEVSNFAKPGQECQHNKHYWFYDDYIGIGPGAHSRLTIDGKKHALRRHRSPEEWLKIVEDRGNGMHKDVIIEGHTLVEEYLMMRMRLVEGFSLEAFLEKTGQNLFDCIPEQRFRALETEGLLTINNTITPTFNGLKKLNAVLGFLLKEKI